MRHVALFKSADVSAHSQLKSIRRCDPGGFRFGFLVKFHADDFAGAVFFHRHAVEYVGHAEKFSELLQIIVQHRFLHFLVWELQFVPA
jgi:hypothetical protein